MPTFFTPMFYAKIFYAKIFLRQIFFMPKFFDVKFFYAKFFYAKNVLRQNNNFTPKSFFSANFISIRFQNKVINFLKNNDWRFKKNHIIFQKKSLRPPKKRLQCPGIFFYTKVFYTKILAFFDTTIFAFLRQFFNTQFLHGVKKVV